MAQGEAQDGRFAAGDGASGGDARLGPNTDDSSGFDDRGPEPAQTGWLREFALRAAITSAITLGTTLLAVAGAHLIFFLGNERLTEVGQFAATVIPLILTPIIVGAFICYYRRIKLLEAEMRRFATFDSLTRLLRRREFLARLEYMCAALARARQTMAVIYIDLDHFKAINDTHGHIAGDRVLASFGRVLKGAIRRKTDLVGRIGGEEFAVALADSSNQGATHIAEQIRQAALSDVVAHDGQTIAYTASLGVCVAACNSQADIDRILGMADKALYTAKCQGRNRVILADPDQGSPEPGAARIP